MLVEAPKPQNPIAARKRSAVVKTQENISDSIFFVEWCV